MSRPPRILRIAVDLIRDYERNPRHHPDDQLRHIGDSLRRFGFVVPVLLDDDNVLVAGHGRVAAAKQVWDSGFDIPGIDRGFVPVLRVSGLTPAEIRAYRIADNKLAQLSHFDEAGLNATMRELCGPGGFAAGALGFDEAELAMLLRVPERTDPNVLGDSTPAAPGEMVNFSCLMSAEQRDAINEQLARLRERLSLPSQGHALAAACRRFVAQ